MQQQCQQLKLSAGQKSISRKKMLFQLVSWMSMKRETRIKKSRKGMFSPESAKK
jgi:hypothetical protein